MLSKAELLELLEVAKHAAGLAAAVHGRAMHSGKLKFDTKSSNCDLVTEIDPEAERVLVEAIRGARLGDQLKSGHVWSPENRP